ncbi:MAG: hypothetical protein AAFN50_09440, partial [Pseudomonadota bacterium]
MMIQAVVLGASGYVGGELLRLVAGHPEFELAAAVSDSKADTAVRDTFGHLAIALPDAQFVGRSAWIGDIAEDSKVALFCAAPHGEAAKSIADALNAGAASDLDIHVVDASADFRFAEQAT